jgi:hypothetical protein
MDIEVRRLLQTKAGIDKLKNRSPLDDFTGQSDVLELTRPRRELNDQSSEEITGDPGREVYAGGGGVNEK